jgi:hypothetical protein
MPEMTITEFKGSISENSILSISKRENLLHRLGYELGALEFWKKQGDPGQIKFFQGAVNLLHKRLKLKRFAEVVTH